MFETKVRADRRPSLACVSNGRKLLIFPSTINYFFFHFLCFPSPRPPCLFLLIDPFSTCPDADELEWYIPAGISLRDLRQPLAVIEQFEKSPLDLGGKRASRLLRKKRRSRRQQRQRPRHTSADESSDHTNTEDA